MVLFLGPISIPDHAGSSTLEPRCEGTLALGDATKWFNLN